MVTIVRDGEDSASWVRRQNTSLRTFKHSEKSMLNPSVLDLCAPAEHRGIPSPWAKHPEYLAVTGRQSKGFINPSITGLRFEVGTTIFL